MRLQDKIKKDLMEAMKAKDDDRKNTLRVIMGEFGRQDQKEISDADVIKIVKKLVKSEKEVMERSGATEPSPFIAIAEGYLPQLAGEEEIRTWISDNINFDEFKNKMQAMKPIMQHFGSNADGNLVKKVLSGF
jgi:uncharacterized protein YqeY